MFDYKKETEKLLKEKFLYSEWQEIETQGHLIEEMAELIVELNKVFIRKKNNRYYNLIEEYADVKLMMEEFEYLMRLLRTQFDNELEQMLEKKFNVWKNKIGG